MWMPVPVTFQYGLNADGSPKRGDMFTLRAVPRAAAAGSPKTTNRRSIVSEGTQEVIVDMARRRLIVPRPKKIVPAPPATPPVKEPEKVEVTRKEEGSQTDLSYCQHECSKHPRVNGNGNGNGKGKSGKNGKGGTKETAKDAGDDSGKESERNGGRNSGKKKNGKGKQPAHYSSDAESSDSESDSEAPTGTGKKVRIDPDLPFGKRLGGKGRKGGASMESWDPSTLPYLAALLPRSEKLSKSEKQALERHAQRSREALTASRSADEEEARRWVSEQLAATHSGALRWLRERDVTRQTAATAATSAFFGPAELKIALEEIEGARRRRSSPSFSPEPILKPTPDPHTPLWAIPEDLEPVVRGGRSLSTPLVLFQDNDHISTLDGRPVRIVRRTGNNGSPRVSVRGGGPLRESSGNTTVTAAPAQSNISSWGSAQPNNGSASNNQNGTKSDQAWGATNNNTQDDWSNANSSWDNTTGQENQAPGNDSNANANNGEVFDPVSGISFKRPETTTAPEPNW